MDSNRRHGGRRVVTNPGEFRGCRRHRASRCIGWPIGDYHNVAGDMSHCAAMRCLSQGRVGARIDKCDLARTSRCSLSRSKDGPLDLVFLRIVQNPGLTVACCEFSRVRFTGSRTGAGRKSRRRLNADLMKGCYPVSERAGVGGRVLMAIMTAAIPARRRQTYAQRMRSDAGWMLPRPKDVRRRARRTEVIRGSLRLVTAEASYAGER